MGLCSAGPMVTVQSSDSENTLYKEVSPKVAKEIIESHIVKETPIDDNIIPSDFPFFAKQMKLVLAHSGLINPARFEEYVALGGYNALAHVLRDMTPSEVCETIHKSGLRGRGGGGYPAGLKWNLVRRSQGSHKFVIANCDEGDPGAYMDRTLVESNPHQLLEGMAIAGYAVGADQGYIFVRGGYPGASKRLDQLETAIRSAERNNLLGGRILNSKFGFRIDLRVGAGAFVCGEETALMASVMGRRGQPVPRPPYPSDKGLWGYPTLINNVESLSSVSTIINHGAENYSKIGTTGSKGTKIFALAGQLKYTGLIEVPMGITLREIVYDIGGGMLDGRTFKAAQTGGPSGGCIPAEHLDIEIDYEKFREIGSSVGSGGLIVLDNQSCMPDLARFFMEFCMDESCGKCVPCRVGTRQTYDILDNITKGSATMDDLVKLEDLCIMMQETSLCGLGQAAPNPILSTLRYFRDEYEAHIKDHFCPATECKITKSPILDLVNGKG